MTIAMALFAGYGKTLANITYVFSTAGTFANTSPAGYTKVTVEAIGGGGYGFGSGTASQRAGGGGGTYARTPTLSITGGTTVVNILVGSIRSNSWVNIVSNAAPTSTAQGCLGTTGTNAAASTAGTITSGSIGSTTFNGGTGTTGSTGVGGGGAGASSAASGQTAGTDTFLVTTPSMSGGTGGASGGGVGTAPGGGGGGSTTAGTNPAGAIGRVRITYSP